MKKNPSFLIDQLLKQKDLFIKQAQKPHNKQNEKNLPKSPIKKKRENSLKKLQESPKRKRNNSANPLN